MENNGIKIASEKGCPDCWGSGVKEIQPFYYICCMKCQGSGMVKNEEGKKDEN